MYIGFVQSLLSSTAVNRISVIFYGVLCFEFTWKMLKASSRSKKNQTTSFPVHGTTRVFLQRRVLRINYQEPPICAVCHKAASAYKTEVLIRLFLWEISWEISASMCGNNGAVKNCLLLVLNAKYASKSRLPLDFWADHSRTSKRLSSEMGSTPTQKNRKIRTSALTSHALFFSAR